MGVRHLRRDALHGERFDDVTDLHGVEVAQRDTALEAVLNLAGIVLEALESFDAACVNGFAIADEAHLVVATDRAVPTSVVPY